MNDQSDVLIDKAIRPDLLHTLQRLGGDMAILNAANEDQAVGVLITAVRERPSLRKLVAERIRQLAEQPGVAPYRHFRDMEMTVLLLALLVGAPADAAAAVSAVLGAERGWRSYRLAAWAERSHIAAGENPIQPREERSSASRLVGGMDAALTLNAPVGSGQLSMVQLRDTEIGPNLPDEVLSDETGEVLYALVA